MGKVVTVTMTACAQARNVNTGRETADD